MTAIVGMALGEGDNPEDDEVVLPPHVEPKAEVPAPAPLFTTSTRAIIYGRQFVAAQVVLNLMCF
jgi:hypothetical protein